MPNFNYKARDKSGKLIKNSVVAESRAAVADKLKAAGCIPISIEEQKKGAKAIPFIGPLMNQFNRVRTADLHMFTKQLAVLQRAGVPFVQALKALKEQSENPRLQTVVGEVLKDIEGGDSLSSALEKYPDIFDNLYINLVRAGETGGVLTDSLERLAKLLEADEKMQMKIKSALRYPIMVVIALVVGLMILVAFVVPGFASIYGKLGAELPLPTQILLGTHYVLTKLWWLILLILGGAAFLFVRFINTKLGRRIWDAFSLKVIIFGPLSLKIALSRFARTTSILMRSGVPILDVLDLSAAVCGNVVIAQVIRKIKDDVNRGLGMAQPMKTSGMFPAIVVQMVSVGEDTGKTDELLGHVSEYYDSQIDYTVENLTSLIEPILLLVMGGAVLLLMLGMFLPMWNMGSLLTKH